MYAKILTFFLLPLVASCAYTTVKPVKYDDTGRRGARFYEPMPILITTCRSVSMGWIPDFSRGYSVQARAWFAKNTLRVDETNGMLGQLHSQLDASSILGTFGTVASEAIEQTPKFATLGTAGDIPFAEPGIWKFDYDNETGTLLGLSRVFEGPPCSSPPGAKAGTSGGSGPRGDPRPAKPQD